MFTVGKILWPRFSNRTTGFRHLARELSAPRAVIRGVLKIKTIIKTNKSRCHTEKKKKLFHHYFVFNFHILKELSFSPRECL